MKSLADILKNKQRLSPMMRGVLAAQVVEYANDFIALKWGENGTRSSKAVYIKNGTIFIACLSSVIAQEIRLHEAELLKAVNQKSGENNLKKIRYLS